MLVLQVTFHVKPEVLEAFLAAGYEDSRDSVANEPGCHQFTVIQDNEDPNQVTFFEVYTDEAALDAHRQTPHFKKYAETTQGMPDGPIVRRFGKSLAPADDWWQR